MTLATRRLLRAKARLGRWDRRYLRWYPGIPDVFTGVPGDIAKHLRRSLMRAYGRGMVVTATTNGNHATNSFHFLKRAFDVGLIHREIGTLKGTKRLLDFQRSEFNAWARGRRPGLQELIGPDNDAVVLRGVHSPLAEGSPLEQAHDNHVHVAY